MQCEFPRTEITLFYLFLQLPYFFLKIRYLSFHNGKAAIVLHLFFFQISNGLHLSLQLLNVPIQVLNDYAELCANHVRAYLSQSKLTASILAVVD